MTLGPGGMVAHPVSAIMVNKMNNLCILFIVYLLLDQFNGAAFGLLCGTTFIHPEGQLEMYG